MSIRQPKYIRMTLKRIIWITCIGIFSLNVSAQKQTITDSIIQSVQQVNDYNQKVELLQKSIKEIYNTEVDETIVLARYGLNLAHKKNEKFNYVYFFRLIVIILMKIVNIDSVTVN